MKYFHGTNNTLRPGDVLVPGDQRNVNNWGDGANNSVVWLHDNPQAAGRYGANVYEVEPIGYVDNFSKDAGHADSLPPNEWEYITESATVLSGS